MSVTSILTHPVPPGSNASMPELSLVPPFASKLAGCGLELRRGATTTLQVNVGFLCNQVCRHCHLDAGPARTEVMSRETMAEVAVFAGRARFSAIDVTGGAPELVPGIASFLERLAPLAPRLLFRANLTALADRPDLIDLLSGLRATIVASFPSLNAGQTDAQRGRGVFDRSIATLKLLNGAGYGAGDSGLELDLVANPAGAFLPPAQRETEERFHRELARSHGIAFDHLYTFANAPLGRFRDWLRSSGNLAGYLRKLADGFNPCTVEGLMCRHLVSVAWDGVLYDCDFNLSRGLPLGGVRRNVADAAAAPAPGTPIATEDHCYACTAGSGFT